MQAVSEADRNLVAPRRFPRLAAAVEGRGECRLASAALRDLAFELGAAPGRKTITPQMEAESSDFHCGLLRGLFDADGSVQGSQDKGVSVRLTQSDLSLAAKPRSACCCAWASTARSTVSATPKAAN